MSGPLIGTLCISGMLVLMFLRVPIAVSMFVSGSIGYISVAGLTPLLGFLKSNPYSQLSSYSLSVVPMFLLMGHLATHAGISKALFRAANAFFGSWRGGLSLPRLAAARCLAQSAVLHLQQLRPWAKLPCQK